MDIPLPTLQPTPRTATKADRDLITLLVAAMKDQGVELPEFVQQKMEEAATAWRVEQVERFAAVYLAVALHAGSLHTAVAALRRGAVQHPHGATPRMLVFKEEFDALVGMGGDQFIQPAIAEAQRLNQEIQVLMASRREADSARAALQRIAADLEAATTSHELVRAQEVAEAAEAARDLAYTELRRRPEVSGLYPSESELATAYFPVTLTEFAQLKKGDVIFQIDSKTVVYQHGNPREATMPAPSPEEFVKFMAAHVILRPLGAPGVLALRWRQTVQRLKVLAEAETRLDRPIHNGRAQGMRMAHEWLSLPAWTLPPLKLNAVSNDKGA